MINFVKAYNDEIERLKKGGIIEETDENRSSSSRSYNIRMRDSTLVAGIGVATVIQTISENEAVTRRRFLMLQWGYHEEESDNLDVSEELEASLAVRSQL